MVYRACFVLELQDLRHIHVVLSVESVARFGLGTTTILPCKSPSNNFEFYNAKSACLGIIGEEGTKRKVSCSENVTIKGRTMRRAQHDEATLVWI